MEQLIPSVSFSKRNGNIKDFRDLWLWHTEGGPKRSINTVILTPSSWRPASSCGHLRSAERAGSTWWLPCTPRTYVYRVIDRGGRSAWRLPCTPHTYVYRVIDRGGRSAWRLPCTPHTYVYRVIDRGYIQGVNLVAPLYYSHLRIQGYRQRGVNLVAPLYSSHLRIQS